MKGSPVRRWFIPLLLGLAASPGAVRAQVVELPPIKLKRIRVPSCPAADSLVGAPTKAQRRAMVRISPLEPDGKRIVLSGPPNYSGRKSSVLAELPVPPTGRQLGAMLSVLVPPKIVDQAVRDSAHLVLLAGDSLQLDFGVPVVPYRPPGVVTGPVPLSVTISPASLLALARAPAITARLNSAEIRLTRGDVVDINGLFRVVQCGQAASPPEAGARD